MPEVMWLGQVMDRRLSWTPFDGVFLAAPGEESSPRCWWAEREGWRQ